MITTIASIINLVLSLLGGFAVIGMIIGIPIGISYLKRRVVHPDMIFDARSGEGLKSVIPPEIQHWNWGAAGLSWIWGASHRVWISFLVFIPFINIFFWIWLGQNGNERAWRANKWESVDSFLATQRKWRTWGIVFFVLAILGGLARVGSGQ